MEVYGLTGGIGSGKSTVAEMLEEYGIPVVSADELSRMVVAPGSRGLTDVVEAFGAEVLDDKGELDRKKMGRIVFTTPERRRQLEAILHPRIRERYEQVLDALEKAGPPGDDLRGPAAVREEARPARRDAGVILVTATTDTRIARVKARDTLTTDDVLARMRAQMPEQDKRQRADYIIHNDGELDDLRREVEHLISRFLRLPPRSGDSAVGVEIEAVLELDPALELEPTELEEAELEEAELEEAEIEEAELEESEIDTLSPHEILDEVPTAELDLRTPSATPHEAAVESRDYREASGELEITMHTSGNPELEVSLSATGPMMPSPPPNPGPAPMPVASPPPSVIAPTVAVPPPAMTAPVVAGGPPSPSARTAPSVAPPSPGPIVPTGSTGPSRTHRARLATAPQMVVPFVREKPLAQTKKTPSDDGEPSA